jgi:hypothetical protein
VASFESGFEGIALQVHCRSPVCLAR